MSRNGGRVTGYHTLTRQELKGFDRTARDIILKAMERGGTGRVSSRGHAILRAPNGQTMAVSRVLRRDNRGMQNTLAEYRRNFCADLDTAEACASETVLTPPPPPVVESEAPTAPEPVPDVKEPVVPKRNTIECPAHGCDEKFATPEDAVAHANEAHYACRACAFWSTAPQGLSSHRRIVHEGARPGRKKAMEEAPVQQGVEDPAVTLAKVREALGASPREAELTEELEAARRRIGELEAKLALLREALEV